MSQKKQICKDFGSVVEDEDLFKAIDEQGNAYVSRKINSGFDWWKNFSDILNLTKTLKQSIVLFHTELHLIIMIKVLNLLIYNFQKFELTLAVIFDWSRN